MRTISMAVHEVTARSQILLPHLIAIPDGAYEVYAARHVRTIQLSHPTQIVYETEFGQEVILCEEQSLVSMDFSTDVDLMEAQNVVNEFSRCTNITLTTANRLIDWYRVQTGRHHITQLVFPQLVFAQLIDVGPPMRSLQVYRHEETRPVDEPLSDDEVQTLRQNLIKRQPPPLEELLLLDAEEAFSQHRYKECTLICWSAIESIFDPLIRAKLKERLPDIGFDIGQAGWNIERDLWFFTRLDVLPRLLSDFSFKELPDDFWNRLQLSRNVRNQVVHEGEDVEEDDAQKTLAVTREFVHAAKAFRESVLRSM
jgi:hypothetical protein